MGKPLQLSLLAGLVWSLSSGASGVWAAEAEVLGQQLAQQVYDRPDGKDSGVAARMVLTERGHAPRVRTLYIYRLEKRPGEVWSLIRFIEPGDIRDTGLLTLDYPGDQSDQWVYLPALKQSRRIPSARKGGRFVGSDLYYEDLQDREVALDRHRLVGEESLAGTKAGVLESVPVDAANSVYSKRISWIHPDTLLALRIDYFEKGRTEPGKRFTAHRIDKVQGYWTIMDSTVEDLQSGHQTRIVVDRIEYDRNLPQSLFSQRALEDPASELSHRP